MKAASTTCGHRQPRILAALAPIEIADFLPEPLFSEMRALAGEFTVVDSQKVKADAMRTALTHYNPEVLVASWRADPLPVVLPPALRYVCFLGGSVRRLVELHHIDQGLLVTNWGNSVSRIVAEGALMLVLMSLRRAGDWNTRMHRDGYWINGSVASTCSLFGRRVGIHGFGNVGREFVRLLQPFGVAVSAFDPYVPFEEFAALNVQHVSSLDELFADHDIVVELAALSRETVGSVRGSHFAALPDGAVFVNVGRGAVVDESALIAAAQSGRIHFGLDVFHQEPLRADYPLRGLSNVVLLPHVAGPTPDRRADAGRFGLVNLRRYVAGLPLEAVVTREIYERTT